MINGRRLIVLQIVAIGLFCFISMSETIGGDFHQFLHWSGSQFKLFPSMMS